MNFDNYNLQFLLFWPISRTILEFFGTFFYIFGIEETPIEKMRYTLWGYFLQRKVDWMAFSSKKIYEYIFLNTL